MVLFLVFVAEIEPHIDIERAKEVFGLEVFAAVLEGVGDDTHARIPPHVVIDHGEPEGAVEVEVLGREVAEGQPFALHVAARLLVGEADAERGVEEPVAGEDPVVGIATRDVDVVVVERGTLPRRVVFLGNDTAARAGGDEVVESPPVHRDVLIAIANADERRSCRSALDGALAEGSGVGELAVVEDIVCVEALVAGGDATKLHVAQGFGIEIVAEIATADIVAVARLAVVEVEADLVAIETEVEVGAVVDLVVEVGDVDGVADEDPAVAEVGTDAQRHIGREGDGVAEVGLDAVQLVGVRVLDHERVVVALRLDIGGIHLVEFADVVLQPALLVLLRLAHGRAHPGNRIPSRSSDGGVGGPRGRRPAEAVGSQRNQDGQEGYDA